MLKIDELCRLNMAVRSLGIKLAIAEQEVEEGNKRLLEAISELPELQQKIIRYKVIHGMTWNDVGETVNYSASYVKNLYYSAMDMLFDEVGV